MDMIRNMVWIKIETEIKHELNMITHEEKWPIMKSI